MADEWVQVRARLRKDPKVIQICKRLRGHEPFQKYLGVPVGRLNSDAIAGLAVLGLIEIWAMANSRGIPDGNDFLLLHCSFEDAEQIGGVPGLPDAMRLVHWLSEDEHDGVSAVRLPNFVEFNRPEEIRTEREERKRQNNRERQRRLRESKKCSALPSVTESVTDALRHAPTEQNRTEQNNHPSIPLPPTPTVTHQADGRMDGFSWPEVMTSLAEAGVVNVRQTVAEARDGCSCTAEHAMKLIDYAKQNGLGPGAIVWRFKRSYHSTPIEKGWPTDGDLSAKTVEQVEKLAAKKRKEDAESMATLIIKAGRKAKKTEDEILSDLKAKNLEWPK